MVSFLDLEGVEPASAAREAADAITAARKDIEQRGVKSFLFASASAEEFDQRAEFSEVPDILDEVADKYLGSPDQRAKLTATLRREFVAQYNDRNDSDVQRANAELAQMRGDVFQVMGPNVRTYVHPKAGCSADGQEQVVDADQTALGAGPVCPHCQVRFSVKPEKTASDPCGGCPAGTKCVCTHDGCRCVKTSAKTAGLAVWQEHCPTCGSVKNKAPDENDDPYFINDLCPGCDPQGHAAQQKVVDARARAEYESESRAERGPNVDNAGPPTSPYYEEDGVQQFDPHWHSYDDPGSAVGEREAVDRDLKREHAGARSGAKGKYDYAHPDSEMNSKLHYIENHSMAAEEDGLWSFAPLKSWRAVHKSDHESRPNDLDHVHHDGPGYMPPGTEHEYSPGARSGSVKTAWNGRCDFCGDDFDDRDSDNYGEEEKECVMPGCGNRSVHEGHGIEVALDPEFPDNTDFICDSHWNYGGKAKGFNEGGKGVSLTPDARRVLGLSPLRPSRSSKTAQTDDDGDYDHRPVEPKGYAVCPTCEGRGSHVNPSIDSHGLTAEDFAEDPDFEEAYFSGAYDVRCAECHGKRVVPQCASPGCKEPAMAKEHGGWSDHRDSLTGEHHSTCYEHLPPHEKEEYESNAAMDAEMAAERRMGA